MYQFFYYNERVKKEIDSLPPGIYASFARIRGLMIKHGPDIGLPHTRPFGEGLFEIRAHGAEGICRIFYCTMSAGRIILLHSFVKKTHQTPARELAKAKKRLREVKYAWR
ncbi:MAG TPA: hypothetical protein DET40_20515 [Lentisphaeria bacterium]|nr:MAG: hypothetical protein A2X45_16250 [Lentisphaerae bacterium GWF2_50_93]HCE45936.1 hypothetical protein [Lentisphaeria bacterium]